MTFPNLSFWATPILIVGLEGCVIVALALLTQRFWPQPRWRRVVWQTALVCLLGVLVSEWTGLGRGAIGLFTASPPQITLGSALGAPLMSSELAADRFPNSLNHTAASHPLPGPVWWPAWLWLAGTALVLSRAAMGQILLVVLRLRRPPIFDDRLQQRAQRVARLVGLRRTVSLLRLPQALSPVAFGWLRPAIGLPPDFETRFNPAEQEAILAHELAHLAARDPLWFLFADIVTALLWWHPFAWWARRSLRSASELAADEAAALVPDGPDCLARCLVQLAQRMTAAWGWAGINGGFRSSLGKRVERLLRSTATMQSPGASRAQRLVAAALPCFIVPCVVLCFGAAKASGFGPNSPRESWSVSPAGLLLAEIAAPEPPRAYDSSSLAVTNTNESRRSATRLQDAKLLFEMGHRNEAVEILKNILQEEPTNGSALYYLNLIKESRDASTNSLSQPARPEMFTRTFRVDPVQVRDRLRAIYGAPAVATLANRVPGQSFDDGARRADENHDSLGGPTPPSVHLKQVHLTNDTEQLNQMLRSYFQSLGVSGLAQPDDTVVPNDKRVFFNERTGLILARATADDLATIAQAIQGLNWASAPPQIVIEAKLVNLTLQEGDALGLNWFLENASNNLVGLMSDAQFHRAMDSILHHTSEDVLSAPKVTTLSGRQTRVVSPGVSLDFVAVVGTNGWTIDTFASATAGSDAQSWHVFGSHPLRDGETLVLGQYATNHPDSPLLHLVFVTPTIIDPVGNRVHQ